MKRILILAILAIASVAAHGQSFNANLTGAAEIPGPGDPDGAGLAVVTVNGTSINYVLFVQGLSTITGAHIHRASDSSVVVNFNPNFSGGGATGTVPGAAQSLINEIVANPSAFYVNVHSSEFPNGAIRGTLISSGSGSGQEAPSTCVPSDAVLCLTNNRFKVEATWTTTNGQTGAGHGVKLTNDSGYFWFFNADNVEMTVKTLNACSGGFASNWVFASGLTNVQVVLKVTDTSNGKVRTYANPQGVAYQAIQDTAAFDCQ